MSVNNACAVNCLCVLRTIECALDPDTGIGAELSVVAFLEDLDALEGGEYEGKRVWESAPVQGPAARTRWVTGKPISCSESFNLTFNSDVVPPFFGRYPTALPSTNSPPGRSKNNLKTSFVNNLG
jgi:hypothetical protein